ncbi:MAG: hypothetical protein M1839_008176 [Geoglossum umbratile]|nr:MAG: hypothetical protein M1839_008176 [Geoglossum umbratile]
MEECAKGPGFLWCIYVWRFIDPVVLKDNLPILARPTLPLPRGVNPVKTPISELTALETEELNVLRDDRKDRNREYEKQWAPIEILHTLIHETVSRSYYTYLIKKDDMLVELKQRVAPSDKARELLLEVGACGPQSEFPIFKFNGILVFLETHSSQYNESL